jgi:hypothetical protein
MADIDTPNDRTFGERVENLNITPAGKLKLREGSEILDSDHNQITSGKVREAGRTGSIINYEDDLHLIVRSRNSLFAKNEGSWTSGTAWTKIQTSANWAALPSFKALTAAGTVAAHMDWQGHALIVGKDESTGGYISPQKVYLDNANTWKVRNATLPAPESPTSFVTYTKVLARSIELANALKTTLNSHIDNSTQHAAAYTGDGIDGSFNALNSSDTYLVTATRASDEVTLITLTKDLLAKYNAHANIEESQTGYYAHRLDELDERLGYSAEHLTVSLSWMIPDPLAPTSAYECARILNKLLWCVNLHMIGFMEPDTDVSATTWPMANVAVTWALGGAGEVQFDGAQTYRTGDPIIFHGGTPPSGVSLNVTYYAINNLVSTKLNLALTVADAIAGTAIAFGGSPSGVTYANKQLTNLHPGTPTTPCAGVFGWNYAFPEGFGIRSGTNTSYNPALNSAQFATEAMQFIKNCNSHFRSRNLSSDGGHANTGRGWQAAFEDEQFFFNGTASSTAFTTYTYDWQIFGGLIKAYAFYRIHRAEGSGYYHVAATDTADSAPIVTKETYCTKYLLDPFSSTTWNFAKSVLADGQPKLTIHAAQGVARHVNGANTLPHTFTVSTHLFTQKRYALVLSASYKTFKNLLFEEKSAPVYTDSYCLGNITDQTDTFGDESVASLLYGISLYEIENIDLDSVNLEVYRTIDGGTTFYLASVIKASDVATSTGVPDSVSDETLVANAIELYTNGGAVGRDPAPRAKSIARVGDYIAFGGIVEEAEPRIVQWSGTFASTVDIPIANHGCSVGDVVVFAGGPPPTGITEGRTYYVEGPLDGGGVMDPDLLNIAEFPGGSLIPVSSALGITRYMGAQQLTELKNRVRQSFPAIGWSSPADFYVDLESDVVQVAKAQEHFVAVCKRGVYRLEGRYAEDGTGGMIAKQISERVSGVSALGGITVRGLFFFMGRDGFYMTDGYQVKPITPHMQKMTSEAVSQDLTAYAIQDNGVQCTYDSKNNRILWTVNPGIAAHPTELWVLHLTHSAEKGAFTKWTGGDQFRPTAVGFFRGNVIRGDSAGFLFKHLESLKSDTGVTRDVSVPIETTSDVLTTAVKIPFLFRTLPEAFGSAGLRKWVSKVLVKLTNLGNVLVAMKSINDRNATYASSMTGIEYETTDYSGQIKEIRTFPAGAVAGRYQGLRCHEKQLQLEYVNTSGTETQDFELQSLTFYYQPIEAQPNPPKAT